MFDFQRISLLLPDFMVGTQMSFFSLHCNWMILLASFCSQLVFRSSIGTLSTGAWHHCTNSFSNLPATKIQPFGGFVIIFHLSVKMMVVPCDCGGYSLRTPNPPIAKHLKRKMQQLHRSVLQIDLEIVTLIAILRSESWQCLGPAILTKNRGEPGETSNLKKRKSWRKFITRFGPQVLNNL